MIEAAGDYADALLRREAARCRLERLGGYDPLAGLKIDDAEVDRLLAQLAGERDEKRLAKVAKAMGPVVEAARRRYLESLSQPSLLGAVSQNAALEPPAAEVLGVLAAIELDVRRQRLLGYVQDDVTRTRPTLDTLRRLFGDQGVVSVAHAGPLRRAALVTVDDTAAWAARTVTLAAPVTWALVGDVSPDPDLPPPARPYQGGAGGSATLLLVSGEDRVRRLQTAFAHARANGFLVTPLPTTEEQWAAVVREATVAGLGVVLEVEEDLPEVARWWIERADHLTWVVSARPELSLDQLPQRPWAEQRADHPEATDEEWESSLGDVDRHGHRLTADQLRLVRPAFVAHGGDVDAAVRRLASGPLDRLARRIRPSRTWDDLILPGDRLAQLKELTSRYRHRDTVYAEWGFPAFPSTGLVALFSGQSGTGKTLAAEIVAGDLGLDLYKLDLSSVVSKYIGETEKNLEKVFSAASAGNLVLFFDEADSLFGKRSEVTDARDRYANIEVSYLLQRLEAYDGLVVMATNFQKNIDDAFLRRIHVGVDFPMPEEPERMAIWRHAFPPGAPRKDIDWEFLAKQFKLAGGNIKGAALHSAFLAAESASPITMEMVMLALKREFQKLGRLRTSAEFGKYTELVNSAP